VQSKNWLILGYPKGCLWQKPGNSLAFNCPDLKVGAIHVGDIQGFSHRDEIYSTFLDWTQ
jgi:hypothetical protein